MDRDFGPKVAAVVVLIALTLALAVGLSILLALPVMWLWNWLMPTIFGLPEIGLMQAWGISILSSLLFKSNKFSVSNDSN